MGLKRALKKWRKRIMNQINKACRLPYLLTQRKKFNNGSLSVFSPNCVGGCMLHDVGARFNSPFVNLFVNAEDYLKFLSDPKKYSDMEFIELPTENRYPVAMWGDITIHFVHYDTYQEAVHTFRRRLERVNYDNLYVFFFERDGCTYEHLKEFDALPYRHKVVFTHLPYEEINTSFYIKGYEQDDCIGDILKWDKEIGRKIYDRFDFVQWFNVTQ